jgi:uncharacterized protein YbjT (DUF2867 family)
VIGFHVIWALRRRGRRVRARVRSPEKGKTPLPDAVESAQGDITGPAAVRLAVQGCSVVYHNRS